MKGLVLKSTGSWYLLLGEDNKRYQARIRGKLRLEGIKETNPVAVGDYVMFDIEGEEGIISDIVDRENYIARQSVKKTGHSHILAANVDQALLVVTLAFPRTSLGFIDRFIVSAESFRIPQVIVFNKSDLLTEEQQAEAEDLMKLYQRLDIRCLQTSATKADQPELEKLLQHKKTLISGHSGVGKSTLINQLSKNIQQKTSEISDFSAKGTHTTTFAEMFQLNEHTFIIDTPGIKELGLVNMEPEELSDYFVEMRALRSSCKFGGRCLHINEPKCAVREAVTNGAIAQSRYDSYLSMVRGDDNRK
ncbi:ribosome small subunit-dependent GTPase A [Chryseotalea sanaruensis]|uniref:Small ribosomal subunit biogenesis GTPase RsgA n=1 Tax=Chryseotalea sanaruensis TaxID=2482724 RepID=A0A401U5C2_9BACT|nr:ribosome small subunit-dependent GTPase A [Chryseotalea sanaruensis]GCC50154.1 ribosome small subunit-dependent GTPase A [Chryseotalea sanaruensis]